VQSVEDHRPPALGIVSPLVVGRRLRRSTTVCLGRMDAGPAASPFYFALDAAGATVGTLPCDSTTRLAIVFSIVAPLRRLFT